jgi:hypothetical protein
MVGNVRVIFLSGFAMAFALVIASSAAADDSAGHSISREGDLIHLQAGYLTRTLRVSDGRVALEGIRVNGEPMVAGNGAEVSFRLARAMPNRNPLENLTGKAAAIEVVAGSEGGTDSIEVRGEAENAAPEPTTWVDEREFAGNARDDGFDLATVAITSPRPGVRRLMIRARSLKDPVFAGVSVNLVYEIYGNHPVIRKWVEFHNNSAHWLRLDDLTIDAVELLPGFANQTPLTPSERGAGSSIVGFSNTAQTHGVIVASEIPSALRKIAENGASGYAPEHFEWVLGPAEHFTSEPTFLYGFSGEVTETPSARSLPLDRAVESGFKRFLREQVGVAADHTEIPAPQWSSWTNFGPALTAEIIREQADLAARCGFAAIVIDDGWQRGRQGIEPDPATFPDMDALAAHIHSRGLRLGLWVSSFRQRDEKDFTALPDAALSPEVVRGGGLAMGFAGPWSRYFADDLLSLHDRYQASYFKQDFTNIKYGDLGAGSAARTRKESILRGLRGLFDAQDYLRHNAPSVSNEITHEIYWGTPGVPADLAAVKHAAVYHIPPNDYSGAGDPKKRVGSPGWERRDPEKLRRELLQGCFNARSRLHAHRGLPLEAIEYYGAATVNWQGSLTPQVQDRQVASWLAGAPMLFAGDLASLTEQNIAHYRQRFGIVRRLEKDHGIYRHFQFSGVPTPTDVDWHWWGKLDEDGHGAVVVLRGSGGEGRRAINLPWVRSGERYRVTALFGQRDLGTFDASQLQAGELRLELPPMGQEILELSAP